MAARITTEDVYNQIWDLMDDLGGKLSYFPMEVSDDINGDKTLYVKFPNTSSIRITITKED